MAGFSWHIFMQHWFDYYLKLYKTGALLPDIGSSKHEQIFSWNPCKVTSQCVSANIANIFVWSLNSLTKYFFKKNFSLAEKLRRNVRVFFLICEKRTLIENVSLKTALLKHVLNL